MPQISQLADTYFSQIFWMLVFFGVTFFVIGRGMVPKVLDTMADRNRTIASDLAAAQAARDAAAAEQAAWGETEANQRSAAHDLIAAAKHRAAQATQARLAEATTRIEARIAAAETQIAAASHAALTEFEAVSADLAQDIVRQVAGLAVSAEDAQAAVKGPFAHG